MECGLEHGLHFTGFYWVFLGFWTPRLDFTEFYWVFAEPRSNPIQNSETK